MFVGNRSTPNLSPSLHASLKEVVAPVWEEAQEFLKQRGASVFLNGQLSGLGLSSFLSVSPHSHPAFFPSNKVFFHHAQTCYVTESPRRVYLENKGHPSPTPPFLSLLPPSFLPPVHLFSRTSVLAPRTTAAGLSRVELWRPTVASARNYSRF